MGGHTVTLLAALEQLGVNVQLVENQKIAIASNGIIHPSFYGAIKRHKVEIIQELQKRQCQKIIDDLVARLMAVTTHQEIDDLQAEAEQRLAGHNFYLNDFAEMCGKAHGFLERREGKKCN